jgi:hypothetical protein
MSALGRPKRRWEDNIKVDIEVMCFEDTERIETAIDGVLSLHLS